MFVLLSLQELLELPLKLDSTLKIAASGPQLAETMPCMRLAREVHLLPEVPL